MQEKENCTSAGNWNAHKQFESKYSVLQKIHIKAMYNISNDLLNFNLNHISYNLYSSASAFYLKNKV